MRALRTGVLSAAGAAVLALLPAAAIAAPGVPGDVIGSGILGRVDAEGASLGDVASAPGDASPIEGVTWVLTGQATDGELGELPPGFLISMRLEGGRAGGSGGCNSWFASYTLDGDAISLAEIGSTLMACEEPANTIERTFFANLANAATFAADETDLTIADATGTTILVFEADEPGSVVGSWVASGVRMAGGVVGSATTGAVTATFSDDGTLTGSDGCDTYEATYEVEGPRIRIGPLATAETACPDETLAEQATAYAQALAEAAVWSVEPDGALHLRDADGALLVSFVPADG